MAVEEARYSVLQTDGDIEIRQYEPQILAEVEVIGDLEGAGNAAFRRLFGYISGGNQQRTEIAMTAPVSQEARATKIAMTAPVSQEKTPDGWAVSFMMPASFTMETLPIPDDPGVKLRAVPGRRIVAIRYSGFWSKENYLQHLDQLRQWMKVNRLQGIGSPVWARYNAPFMPWFLRRNEILIEIDWEQPEN